MTETVATGLQARLADVDARLIALLTERIDLLRNSGERLPVWQQDFSAAGNLAAPEIARDARAWLLHAANISSKHTEQREPIVFLGPVYSYSYLAAVKHFGMSADLVPVTTIAAAFDEIDRHQAHFAVVPIENSTDGRIVDTLGRFARSPAQICGEVLLPIHHCLLGRCTRAAVREVHSKPQALSQCRNWLAQHLPDVRLIEVASTATAAATAASQHGVAAIASREAGIHHGCQVIDENIEDNQQNVTRFAIIGDRPCPPTGADKTSLMMQLKHEPGALADAMVTFQQAHVNLTWIESFPLPNRPNEYLFFVELDGHQATPTVAAALAALQKQTQRLDVLGSYPRGT
ncbi:MAG: prephenate dehydratase [Pirellulaceae bacterium]